MVDWATAIKIVWVMAQAKWASTLQQFLSALVEQR
jgi:hypothetical protein